MGPEHQSFCCWLCSSPLLKPARTTPAVASGRSVTLSPFRSSNVYISFSTMSVSSPIERLKSSVRSSTGRRTR